MMVFSSSTGDMPVSFTITIQAIANGLGLTHYALSPVAAGVVWQHRMSRALMAASSGGGLALCGLVLHSPFYAIRLLNPICWEFRLAPQLAPSVSCC